VGLAGGGCFSGGEGGGWPWIRAAPIRIEWSARLGAHRWGAVLRGAAGRWQWRSTHGLQSDDGWLRLTAVVGRPASAAGEGLQQRAGYGGGGCGGSVVAPHPWFLWLGAHAPLASGGGLRVCSAPAVGADLLVAGLVAVARLLAAVAGLVVSVAAWLQEAVAGLVALAAAARLLTGACGRRRSARPWWLPLFRHCCLFGVTMVAGPGGWWCLLRRHGGASGSAKPLLVAVLWRRRATTMDMSGCWVWCNWAKAFTDEGGHDGGDLWALTSLLGASW
jgi:hypothetical protein